ncbi:hypothetical protein COHA_005688 [Chlorella ohadii]|uniref:Uncharacterized protein n=1 Tax=Chlorella ohadii TaxID=2649997 RepID=A0AAD5H5X2_9CHLO|nr:hypothetical protein COHA_005688 [Chlorella ohadii]
MHRLELVAWAGDEVSEGSYASAFATCLSAAGTAAQLTRLSAGALRFDLHTEWLRTMRWLRKLTLTTDNALHIAPAVSALTALQSLGLRSSGLQLPAEVRLPTSITRLWHLKCYTADADVTAEAIDALPHLTGLTCLVLSIAPDMPPAALSGLLRLQLCQLERSDDPDIIAEDFALPGGPWLRSLRWLSTDLNAVLSSTAALHAATALECVSVAALPADVAAINWQSPAAAAFFNWLAQHPPLQRLSIESSPSLDSAPNLNASKHFLVHLLQLCRRRPALAVHFPGPTTEGQSLARHLSACHRF